MVFMSSRLFLLFSHTEKIMKIWQDIGSFEAKSPVVTIGIFDGVHKGHQFLLSELKKNAKESGGESVVVTLWPHPRIVLNKDPDSLRYLTTIEEKMLLLKEFGIDHFIVIPFTKEFAALKSCEFVEKYLVNGIHLERLLIGHNHKFGKNREGDFISLQDCSRRFGFGMEKFPPFHLGGENISSSSIRGFLTQGDVENANRYLGYDFFMQGIVTNGKQLGRKLGFPTANIRLLDTHKLIPKDGVYIVEVSVDKLLYGGMLNIGFNPTVNYPNHVQTIEVNLFDFNGDLYEKQVTMHFRKRLRDEKKFDNLEQLKARLVIDKQESEKELKKVKDKR